MTPCIHHDCPDPADPALPMASCRPHWYELPVLLRNRIWRADTIDNRLGLAKHVQEALKLWSSTAPRLRCHRCKSNADLIDVADNRAICIVCLSAILGGSNPDPMHCARCGSETLALSAVNTDEPTICLDCQYRDLRREEETESWADPKNPVRGATKR